jgi:hypothetical protein
LRCNELSPEIKAKQVPMKKKHELSLQILDHFLKLFEHDLNRYRIKALTIFRPSKHFKFHTYEIPKIEIATSSIYSIPKDLSLRKDEYHLRIPINKNVISKILPIFINIIPRDNTSVVILGYAKGVSKIENVLISKLNKLPTKDLLKLISDILIKRIDNWCCSVKFYEELKSMNRDKEVIRLKHDYLIHPASKLNLIKEMDLNFNLFEGL